MLSKSLRLVTYSLSVDRQMTCCLFPFSIMNFFRLVLRFQTKCIGAKIKLISCYCLDWLPPHTVLKLLDTGTWFLSVWWEVHQTSEDSANLLSFFTIKKGDRRQTFRHAFMNTQYLILLIRSCKLETVLTCLILGSAMEANEPFYAF